MSCFIFVVIVSRFVFPDGSAFIPTAESIEKKILDLSPQKTRSRGKTPVGDVTSSGGALWGDGAESDMERPYLPPRQVYRDHADAERDHGGHRLPHRFDEDGNGVNPYSASEWRDARTASQIRSEVESRSGKRQVAGHGNYSDSVIGGAIDDVRTDDKISFSKMPIAGYGNYSDDLNAVMGSPSRNRESSESRRGKRSIIGKGNNASGVLDDILSPPKGHGYPETRDYDHQPSRGGKKTAQGKGNSSSAVGGLMSPSRGKGSEQPNVWRDASPSGESNVPGSRARGNSEIDGNNTDEDFDVDNALRKNK